MFAEELAARLGGPPRDRARRGPREGRGQRGCGPQPRSARRSVTTRPLRLPASRPSRDVGAAVVGRPVAGGRRRGRRLAFGRSPPPRLLCVRGPRFDRDRPTSRVRPSPAAWPSRPDAMATTGAHRDRGRVPGHLDRPNVLRPVWRPRPRPARTSGTFHPREADGPRPQRRTGTSWPDLRRPGCCARELGQAWPFGYPPDAAAAPQVRPPLRADRVRCRVAQFAEPLDAHHAFPR